MEKAHMVKSQHKIYGPVIADSCDACGQESIWVLTKAVDQFKLFGTPLFNKKTEYCLVCSNCGYGIGLHKSLFDKLRPMAEKNEAVKQNAAKTKIR